MLRYKRSQFTNKIPSTHKIKTIALCPTLYSLLLPRVCISCSVIINPQLCRPQGRYAQCPSDPPIRTHHGLDYSTSQSINTCQFLYHTCIPHIQMDCLLLFLLRRPLGHFPKHHIHSLLPLVHFDLLSLLHRHVHRIGRIIRLIYILYKQRRSLPRDSAFSMYNELQQLLAII